MEIIDKLKKLIPHSSQSNIWILNAIILIIAIQVSSCSIIEIKENEKGVKFERFNNGLNPDIIYNSGYHLFPIWDKAIIYNIDSVSQNEYLYLKSKDNIKYKINLDIMYKVIPDEIGYLENEIGKSYYDRIIIPEIEHAFMDHLKKQIPNPFSSIDTKKFELEIFEAIKAPIRKNYIEIISVKINEISKLE